MNSNVVLCLTLALALVTVFAAPLQAQSGGGDYDLTWSTVDGGGVIRSTGGEYSLSGTSGQPDAGWLMGGDYVLAGGFWGGTGPTIYNIYLPVILSEYP